MSTRPGDRRHHLAVAVLLLVGSVPAAVLAAVPPRPHRIPGFPDAMQMNEVSCGVAVVQAVLAYYDPDGAWIYQRELAKALGTTEADGTSPEAMVRYLRAQGLQPELREGLTLRDLERYVDARVPVILDYEAYGKPGVRYATDWDDGHYSVVRGYDATRIYLMDPSQMPGTNAYLSRAELPRRWHDRDLRQGKVHDYVHMGIVVRGKRKVRKSPVHTD